eukprot:2340334-Rhodomonas_salina.4
MSGADTACGAHSGSSPKLPTRAQQTRSTPPSACALGARYAMRGPDAVFRGTSLHRLPRLQVAIAYAGENASNHSQPVVPLRFYPPAAVAANVWRKQQQQQQQHGAEVPVDSKAQQHSIGGGAGTGVGGRGEGGGGEQGMGAERGSELGGEGGWGGGRGADAAGQHVLLAGSSGAEASAPINEDCLLYTSDAADDM